MFVRYHRELSRPAAEVERALVTAQPEWLSAVAGAAQARSDGLWGEVGTGPLRPRLGRRLRIELGPPVRVRSLTSLPLTWEPVGLEGVLARLDAPLDLGPLGQAMDRGLLPRVAEATRDAVLDRLGAAMALSQPGPAARMPS